MRKTYHHRGTRHALLYAVMFTIGKYRAYVSMTECTDESKYQ